MDTQKIIFNKRQPIIMANWKLNGDIYLLSKLVSTLLAREYFSELVLCPPSILISDLANLLKNCSIQLGGQNISSFSSGAYTGEISAKMLKEAGGEYCIVGHSERRSLFGETDSICRLKIQNALDANLTPILCVGENNNDFEQGATKTVLVEQLKNALKNIDVADKNICIAYEPVWAIGSGKAATPEYAQSVHTFIRQTLNELFDETLSNRVQIMYGGSVNQNNAYELLSQPDIDGLLVGSASLDAEHFSAICQSAEQKQLEACF